MREPDMMTITGAGSTVTVSGAACADVARQAGTEQLDLPFALDQAKLGTFLTRWIAIEEEQDRLREEARLLKEEYAADFPMRAMLVAVKRVRAVIKLENHPKDGMKREHLSVLEGLVEQHLLSRQTNVNDLIQALDKRVAVNMATGEVGP